MGSSNTGARGQGRTAASFPQGQSSQGLGQALCTCSRIMGPCCSPRTGNQCCEGHRGWTVPTQPVPRLGSCCPRPSSRNRRQGGTWLSARRSPGKPPLRPRLRARQQQRGLGGAGTEAPGSWNLLAGKHGQGARGLGYSAGRGSSPSPRHCVRHNAPGPLWGNTHPSLDHQLCVGEGGM